MALQAAGQYAESAEAWRAAEPLMERQDIFHLGEAALSMVFDQNVLAYQPAPYEKPFLHALLCLDYQQIGDWQAARVEALKSLKGLDRHESVVGPIWFVRYVAALAFEAAGDLNDAYIEYKKIYGAGHTDLLPVLIRMADALGFHDESVWYRSEWPDTGMPESKVGREVVMFVFLGKSPRKVTSEVVLEDGYRMVLPVYQTQASAFIGATFFSKSGLRRPGATLTSVESLAATYSGKLFARELLKEIVRRKVKKNLVQKAGKKMGDSAEQLLKTVLFFAPEPDLRTWGSLPSEVKVARLPLGDAEVGVEYTPAAGDAARFISPDTSYDLSSRPRPIVMLRAW